MKISVIHPSRGRPQQAYETASRWISRSDVSFEYVLMCDYSDPLLQEYEREFYKAEMQTVWAQDNHSAIEAINNAAKITTGDLLVIISDDMDCFSGWDTALLAELAGKSDFVLKTQDGIQKTLVTLPILDRTYYNRFGYIYHPEFKHMGADMELTAVAIMAGKLLYSDLAFLHNHYTTGKTPKDAINEKNDLTYQHGDEVLMKHRIYNFGIEKPICSYNMIQW